MKNISPKTHNMITSNIRKMLPTLFVIILFLFFVSWTYKLVCLFILSLIWKDTINSIFQTKHAYIIWSIIISVLIYLTFPRYRINCTDRVQLIYQDKNNNPTHPPIVHYILNALVPEEEIMNLCIWGARFGLGSFPYVGKGTILKQFQTDCKEGKINFFYKPVQKLNKEFLFMMSGTTSQIFNMLGGTRTKSVYLIKPKRYNHQKKYPVVFFCHGGLGNWKLYQGLLKDLNDCIVLSVGTWDWSGIYQTHDIQLMLSNQLTFLQNLGYKVDKSNLHIVGLSNGGSATNIAYSNYAEKFKSLTFLSTGIHHTFPISSKIILIGGGRDRSSSNLPRCYKILKTNNRKVSLLWDNNESHFILVNKQEQVLKYLNKEMFYLKK